jgi:hypothetical protein
MEIINCSCTLEFYVKYRAKYHLFLLNSNIFMFLSVFSRMPKRYSRYVPPDPAAPEPLMGVLWGEAPPMGENVLGIRALPYM